MNLIWREILVNIKEGNTIANAFIFSFMALSIFAYLGGNSLQSPLILAYISCFIMCLNAIIVIPYIFEKDSADGTIAQLLIFGSTKTRIFLVKFISHQIFCVVPCVLQICCLFFYYQNFPIEKYFYVLCLFGLSLSAITIFTASITAANSGILISVISAMPLMLSCTVITVTILSDLTEQFSLINVLFGLFLINLSLGIVSANISIEENFIS